MASFVTSPAMVAMAVVRQKTAVLLTVALLLVPSAALLSHGGSRRLEGRGLRRRLGHAARASSRATATTTTRATTTTTVRMAAADRIAVIGGGIGGLTLANALLQSTNPPSSVTVFERADMLRPQVGGGLQINGGAAVLSRLGLGPEIAEAGQPMKRVVSRRANGMELLDLDVEATMREQSEGMDGATSGASDSLVYDGNVMSFTVRGEKRGRGEEGEKGGGGEGVREREAGKGSTPPLRH